MRRVLAGAGRARILRGEWPDDAQAVADAPDPGRRDDVGDRDLRAVLAADDPDALTPLVPEQDSSCRSRTRRSMPPSVKSAT